MVCTMHKLNNWVQRWRYREFSMMVYLVPKRYMWHPFSPRKICGIHLVPQSSEWHRFSPSVNNSVSQYFDCHVSHFNWLSLVNIFRHEPQDYSLIKSQPLLISDGPNLKMKNKIIKLYLILLKIVKFRKIIKSFRNFF